MASSNSISFVELVEAVLPKHTNIESLFNQFNESIEHEIDELVATRDDGDTVIPEVDFSDIANTGFTAAQQDLIRKRGCVVVRGVIEERQADSWNNQLEQYLKSNQYYEDLAKDIDNGDLVRAKHPNILAIYWSRTQLEIRQSQQLEETKRHLNSLWQVAKSGPGSFDVNKSIAYADRVRIRQPGDQTHGIAPHVDSCSLDAWFNSDSIWHSYKKLLNEEWKDFDPFLATKRVSTMSEPHPDACGVFRTFQGWMALTAQGAHCGTLQLVPTSRGVGWLFLSMLRSSMRDEALTFPQPGEPYKLDADKHATLIRGLTSIPTINAGDSVWWHPDVVHGVEKSNLSKTNSSVAYLGIAPDCQRNRAYLRKQLTTFEKGTSPPDFPHSAIESAYAGRGLTEHLSELGKKQMGVHLDQLPPDQLQLDQLQLKQLQPA